MKAKKYYQSIKVTTLLAVIVVGLMSYFILSVKKEVDFNINWNLFDSWLMWPLFIIGFLVGLGQKFKVYDVFTVTKNADGTEKREKSHDITDNMMGGCLLPILEYFVVFPLVIAALIYYTLMGSIYLFASVFPLFIIITYILLLVFFYKAKNVAVISEKRNILIPLIIIISMFIYWLICYLWVGKSILPLSLAIAVGGTLLSIAAFYLLAISSKDELNKQDLKEVSIPRLLTIATFVSTIAAIGVLLNSSIHSHSNQVEAYSESSREESSVNDKSSDFSAASYDWYQTLLNKKRISQDEREYLKVDHIKIDGVDIALPNNEVIRGQEVYKGAEGRLESIIHVVDDFGAAEMLVSYNKNGDYVDCIVVSSINIYAGDVATSTLNGNKIVVKSSYPPEEGESSSDLYTEYQVASSMKFNKIREWHE